jgi:hypothetical protein
LSRLSEAAAWDCSSDPEWCDAVFALRLLCSSPFHCDYSSASSGVPAVLRVRSVCPLNAVCDEYRRPPFARLSRSHDAAPPLELVMACLLRADWALVMSSADDMPCHYLCYVHEGAVSLEQLSVDAVSESSRYNESERRSEQGTKSSIAEATALLSSSSATRSSYRSSRHQHSLRPAAVPSADRTRSKQRAKQSDSMQRALKQRRSSDITH